MKALRSRMELGLFERYFSTDDALLHRCPVCRVAHEVSSVRAQFAYGKQLTCSPDCEAERRRRSRAAYRQMTIRSVYESNPDACRQSNGPHRDEPDSHARSTLRLVSGAAPQVTLPITVESTEVLCVRRAVFQTAGEAVNMIKSMPVPHSSKERLLVSVRANVLEALREAIMRAVPAGQFGRIHRA